MQGFSTIILKFKFFLRRLTILVLQGEVFSWEEDLSASDTLSYALGDSSFSFDSSECVGVPDP